MASPWQVDVAVPDGLGDLGLHRDEDEAASRFRRQLAEALGAERAAEVGPAAEREFRRARAEYVGKPVLWSGFLLLASHAASGLDLTLDPTALPDDPAEADRVRALADVEDALLLTLSVGVSPVSLPPSGPLTAAGLISRTLRAQFGEDAHVHLVSYGKRQAVASVRVVEPPATRRAAGDDHPPAEQTAPPATVLAEVRVPFVEDGAMVTVTAATAQAGAVDRAVLLAGSMARSVRLRTPGRRTEGAQALGDGPDDAAATPGHHAEPAAHRDGGPATGAVTPSLRVLLPDGTPVPAGLVLLGRGPSRTDARPADHTVTLPDASVSRTHLALRVGDGTVTATDLHSTNGTVVRREGRVHALPAGEEVTLVAGDELNLGRAVLRVVHG
ncbi:FHA domain-containing protein [Georgenia satyanarayanai]|uniref:FHA domain-containing protein n=1 Tax=Georgenia satyanarayanai TaxID=860221 RepID=UPI00186B5110|nr:FHA domain-containing protein [Georgenia satyanarayanai]